jgi:hypothetical protein
MSSSAGETEPGDYDRVIDVASDGVYFLVAMDTESFDREVKKLEDRQLLPDPSIELRRETSAPGISAMVLQMYTANEAAVLVELIGRKAVD